MSDEINLQQLISVQKKLITNKDVPLEIRKLLKDNLVVISAQREQIKKYKDESTVGAIKSIYSSKDEMKTDALVEAMKDIQNYLSINHTNAFNDTKSTNYFATMKSHIYNYIKDKKMLSSLKSKLGSFEFKTDSALADYMAIEILGLSVLHEPLYGKDKDKIEEIRVNDVNDIRFVIDGNEVETDLHFRNPEHLRLLIDRLVRKSDNKVEALSDEVHCTRIPFGDRIRITVIASPYAKRPDGLYSGDVYHMVIRKQKSEPLTREFLLDKGSVDTYQDFLLELIIKYGVSLAFYGDTNTGKTAMLVRYLMPIPNGRRLITISENDEMGLRSIDFNKYITNENGVSIPNPHYLKANNSALSWECPNQKLEIINGLKGFAGLVNLALTFTADTVVLQEAKGQEILSIIEKSTSGSQVITSLHASNRRAFFNRILMMTQGESGCTISDKVLLSLVADAFPIICNCKRYVDGSRKICEVSELIGFNQETLEPITSVLYKYIVDYNKFNPVTGKTEVHGRFFAPNSQEPISPRILSLLKDKGMTDEEYKELVRLYQNSTLKMSVEEINSL